MAEGGGGRGADARLDGRLEFFGARRVVGCALAGAGLDGFFKACLGRGGGVLVYGAGPRGHVAGGTERTVRNREGVETVGGVRPKYWVPRERIRTQPIMCLVDSLVQVLYAFLQG